MKQVIETNLAPEALGPYSQAIKTDDLLFISGQIPIDRATGTMPSTIEEQTTQALKNISYILQAAGLTLDNVVKTTILLSDINNFAKVNEIYGTFFTKNEPARACYEVAAIPKNAMIEIEAIAVNKL